MFGGVWSWLKRMAGYSNARKNETKKLEQRETEEEKDSCFELGACILASIEQSKKNLAKKGSAGCTRCKMGMAMGISPTSPMPFTFIFTKIPEPIGNYFYISRYWLLGIIGDCYSCSNLLATNYVPLYERGVRTANRFLKSQCRLKEWRKQAVSAVRELFSARQHYISQEDEKRRCEKFTEPDL